NTVLSSYFGVTHGELESDPGDHIRAQRLQTATFLQIATQLRGLLAALLGEALDTLRDLLLVDLESLGISDGTEGEVGFDVVEGLIAETVDELLLALAGGLEVALEVEVGAPQTLEEAGENVLHLLPHHRVGHVGGDHLDQRVDHPVSRCEGGLDLLDGTEATRDVGLQLFDGVELGD